MPDFARWYPFEMDATNKAQDLTKAYLNKERDEKKRRIRVSRRAARRYIAKGK